MYIYIYTYIHVYLYIYKCRYTCIHVYIYTHTHTHIQALKSCLEQTTGTSTTVAGERLFFTSFAQLWCEKVNSHTHPKPHTLPPHTLEQSCIRSLQTRGFSHPKYSAHSDTLSVCGGEGCVEGCVEGRVEGCVTETIVCKRDL